MKMALCSNVKMLCHLSLLDVTVLREQCLQPLATTTPPHPRLKINKTTKLVGSSQTSLNFCQNTRRHISEVAYVYVGTLNNTYTKQYEFLSPLALVVTRNIKVLLANLDIL